MSTTKAHKTRFIHLRDQHHFDIITLADRADVEPLTVYHMLLRNPVKVLLAEKVLHALSQMTGQSYSLETVDVVVISQRGV